MQAIGPQNFARAWAFVKTDGVGGLDPDSKYFGISVTDVTTTLITCVLDQPIFDGANGMCVVTTTRGQFTGDAFVSTTVFVNDDEFDLKPYNLALVAQDPFNDVIYFHIVVYGEPY